MDLKESQFVGRGLIKGGECLLKPQLWGVATIGRSNSDALSRQLGEASLFGSLVRQLETTSSCSLEPLLQIAVAEPAVVVAKPAQDKPQRFCSTDGRSISAQQAQ